MVQDVLYEHHISEDRVFVSYYTKRVKSVLQRTLFSKLLVLWTDVQQMMCGFRNQSSQRMVERVSLTLNIDCCTFAMIHPKQCLF